MSTELEAEKKEYIKEYIKEERASILALDLPIEYRIKNNIKTVLHRTHSLDSGLEKIVSVATIEEIKEMNWEVIVPSRNVLIKMPFYSTPLSIESTNNAFRDFQIRLNEMGFIKQEAETALIATKAESVESAIEFIMNNLNNNIEKEVREKIEIEIEIEEIEEIKETEIEIEIEIKEEGEFEKCLICFTDKPLSMFYIQNKCKHNYCNICLLSYYRIKILDGDVLKLSCIDPSCDRLIEEEEILSIISDELSIVEKYKKFRRNKLLQLNPNARFCCKPDCEGIMFGNKINKKLICPKCKQSICFNCNQPWHGIFVGCNQNIDIGYTKWALNKDVQKCPKCRMAIEKDDGCNHMTCSSCKYEFCWICKGPYNDNHFEWWNIFGCPGAQYTPRMCRCPHCFPRWLNRILIILCFLSIVVPLVLIAAIFWFIIICLIFCIRCDFKCDIDPCDCF